MEKRLQKASLKSSLVTGRRVYYNDVPTGQLEGNGDQAGRLRRRQWRPTALQPVTEQGSEAGPISMLSLILRLWYHIVNNSIFEVPFNGVV